MPKKSKKSSSAQTKGVTQISISLAASLVEKVDKMAHAENRNRSNFIANTLQALSEKSGK